MFFKDRLENIIAKKRRYSLKSVSIVVVSTLLSALCLGACGSTASENVQGQNSTVSVAQITEGQDSNNDGQNANNNGLDTNGIGVENDGMGADDSQEIDIDNTNNIDSDDVQYEESYGEYSINLDKNYYWLCDDESGLMYLQTNPNLNIALRGAVLDTDINVVGGTTCVATTIVPIYLRGGDTVDFSKIDGMSRRYFYAQLDREQNVYICMYDSGWKDLEDELVTIPFDTYLIIDYSFANASTEDKCDIVTDKSMSADKVEMLEQAVEVYRYFTVSNYENLYSDNDLLLEEITISEGRSAEGNPYILIKIPSEISDGRQVMPELQQTSWMEYYAYPTYDKLVDYDKKVLFRSVMSPLMYSRVYHTGITINAGLFNIFSNTPQGQTVIDGNVVTNNPMKDDIGDPISPDTECYAMTIDAAGILDYAKHENGSPYRTVDANELVSAGVWDAITGWGCIVYDGKSVVELNPSNVTSSTIFYEKVHRRKVAHQVIGQDNAGNYYILSTNDVDSGYGYGLNYDEAADIMIAAGATFAYMLDGGDSVATIVAEEQLTTIYYEEYGKPVPTVITFVAK